MLSCWAVCFVCLPALLSAAPKDYPEDSAEPKEPGPSRPAASRRLPGLDRDGSILLPTQWSLSPAGKQIKLGDFPVNIALHPKEPWAAILHAGYGEHEIIVVDLKAERVISRAGLPQCFYGLCFDPAGKWLLASGGEHEVVHRFKFAGGYVSEPQQISLGGKQRIVPAGLSVDPQGKQLYVACAWGDKLCELSLEQPEKRRWLNLEKDTYPYAVLPSKDGKRLFVSEWGGGKVATVDAGSLQIVSRWEVQPHPTEMALSPDEKTLFVACANSNAVSVLDASTGQPLETISTALYPNAPAGSTPNSLALSADGKGLLVANADNNNVAVFDVAERGHARSLGFIPVGWYPTSVRFAHDGRILVANGKGLLPSANRQGPNPLNEPPASVREYIGGLLRGTLSIIRPPAPSEMAALTKRAMQASPLRADGGARGDSRGENNPIPAKLGGASPIKHCIYIIKENRTYDQVFGDMKQGNGDPGLCIFPQRVTPNHHALASEFVLLDNFYVESEVSADGHEWSMAAYATDFVEKSWPLAYRPGSRDTVKYPSEGSLAIAAPTAGYIWDRCREAGVSYRSYGEFISNAAKVGDPGRAKVKTLEGHFDPLYRSYDLDYLDVKRTARFLEELKQFEAAGELPQFIVLRLPNDHTFGTQLLKPTPTAMVADNDLALGQLIEGLSQSKFWKDTAVFVVEDDAQNGSDHVDAHRTVALVISPYTKRHFVDSSMYSTSSMLRTMELILNLQPLSQFDSAALPMYASFTDKPDFTPYKHRPAGANLSARNGKNAWGTAESARLDFSREDAADDLLLNEIVWRSVRGGKSKMPPPVRASFVFTKPHQDDEDEDDDD